MSADSTCSTSTATSSVAPSTVASSVLPDDDDVLLAFGIPPTPFSIRPRIQSVVNDARVQRDRDLREAAIPRSLGGAEAYRCVVCTLPGGTCEHSDIWARQASRRLLGPEERSSLLQRRCRTQLFCPQIDAERSSLLQEFMPSGAMIVCFAFDAERITLPQSRYSRHLAMGVGGRGALRTVCGPWGFVFGPP